MRAGVLIALVCFASGALAAPNDPFASSSGSWSQDFADQWALEQQRIYADVAPAEPGEPVIVAVIDTGLDYTHEDLAAEKIWHNLKEERNGRDDDRNGYVDDLIGWNFVSGSGNPWDESGHGTHIAGIIAACTNNGVGIAAVNSAAVIMPLKVANFVGQAKSSDVAAAIYYAVDHGASIINLSLGSELITELEKEAARYAQERDVLLVVSAGNRGLPTSRHGYAALPGALVVGAMDPLGERAGFSNFGDDLAFVAPGVDVLSLRARDTDFIALSDPLDYQEGSAIVGDDAQYYRASGTSFAAAVASGVASRLKSLKPALGARELRTLMTQSAADVDPPGHDQRTGFGGLNFIGALGADPNQVTDVRLTSAGLELDGSTLWIDVRGRLEASDFTTGVLEMRAIEGSVPVVEENDDKRRKKKRRKEDEAEQIDPYAWQTLKSYAAPQGEGQLARLSVEELTRRAGGSTEWELRLTLNDRRVSVLRLALPQPEFPVEEVAGED